MVNHILGCTSSGISQPKSKKETKEGSVCLTNHFNDNRGIYSIEGSTKMEASNSDDKPLDNDLTGKNEIKVSKFLLDFTR